MSLHNKLGATLASMIKKVFNLCTETYLRLSLFINKPSQLSFTVIF